MSKSVVAVDPVVAISGCKYATPLLPWHPLAQFVGIAICMHLDLLIASLDQTFAKWLCISSVYSPHGQNTTDMLRFD